MTNPVGRPPRYPIMDMRIGDTMTFDVPTKADVKRVAKNVSNYNMRYDRFYRCKTDRQTRLLTVTRIR